MAFQGYTLLGFLVLLGSLSNSIAVTPSHHTDSFNRGSFPAGFIFGTASASYQVISPWFCTCLYHNGVLLLVWDLKHDTQHKRKKKYISRHLKKKKIHRHLGDLTHVAGSSSLDFFFIHFLLLLLLFVPPPVLIVNTKSTTLLGLFLSSRFLLNVHVCSPVFLLFLFHFVFIFYLFVLCGLWSLHVYKYSFNFSM